MSEDQSGCCADWPLSSTSTDIQAHHLIIIFMAVSRHLAFFCLFQKSSKVYSPCLAPSFQGGSRLSSTVPFEAALRLPRGCCQLRQVLAAGWEDGRDLGVQQRRLTKSFFRMRAFAWRGPLLPDVAGACECLRGAVTFSGPACSSARDDREVSRNSKDASEISATPCGNGQPRPRRLAEARASS